ncbi:MAG: L,D-transpeptidase [Sedimenticola sp.]|uniref:L,D-transpeptidase n=1 Tax=Sedimenticola thiotaurini TaxID=1543721 RepID=A0A558D5L0_9GAMM|nr:L,D-transpeptidase [Sedimenticola sp.]MCW8950507.1 L,D-transpeptidase [Sedimenticola sp.]MCW8975846.1 L,D-transpeptidase [Sedimenticola sp.]MDF1529745.1 L,D-transpeptidase [Sedimenticola sp.]TVT56305.1 MAG: L,D-transpeptidase [Sedimenticola thiotaurini]
MVNKTDITIQINLAQQRLRLVSEDAVIASYAVSTASNGPGEKEGSGCTPRGLHRIRLKIGDGLPENAVLVGRRYTGEIYTPSLAEANPKRDWILTRILWLTGIEPKKNRGGNVDSLRRFIYIHGTPDSEPMGRTASHGCIRMRNKELIDLFDRVPVGTIVNIC